MNSNRHVCFCSDDGGFAPLLTAAGSLFRAADPSRPLTLHILHYGEISAANRAALSALAAPFKAISLEWHSLDAVMAPHLNALCKVSGHWHPAIWGRCFAAELLPPEIERLVYIDTDVLVCEDLAPLFDFELAGHPFAGVQERGGYINSGVLVMDLAAFRRTGALRRIVDYVAGSGEMSCPDQDALNRVFEGDIAFLPFKWNYTDGWLMRQLKFKITDREWRGISAAEILEAVCRPGIIHYLGGQHKPWKPNHRPERRRYAEAMRLVGQTPPKSEPLAFLHDLLYAHARRVARRRLAQLASLDLKGK